MKRLALLALLVLVLGALVLPSLAQEEGGQGGIIVEGTFGSSGAASLEPVTCTDTTCQRLVAFMYPGLVAVNPEQAILEVGGDYAGGSMATDVQVSEDGLVYTFTLRDDYTWTDGTPITSADFLYGWNASLNLDNQSPLAALATEYGGTIIGVEAPDPQTLVVTFSSADCTALANAGSIPALPSHVLPEDYLLAGSAYQLAPDVTGGVFAFGAYTPEQVALVANPTYPDGELGYVNPTGYVQRLVTDQAVLVQQFLAGETSVIDTPALSARADIRADADAGNAQVFEFPGNQWDYLALNFADPANPQPAVDESGSRLEQGHHPLFGDPRVRRALALATNVDEIMEAAVFGEGVRMASSTLSTSWAFNQALEPLPFDPEAAAALLDEAGFVDDDGDPSTPRVATEDAMYAEAGTPFSFELITNQGNARREAIGQIVQQQWAQIGVQVNFEAIDFNVVLDRQDAQDFDAIILGWRNSFPDDPDQTTLFTSAGDTLGGNNFTSYYNEEVDRLMLEALTLPGCDPEARAELYAQIQTILQEDLPYIWLFSQGGFYAARAEVNGFSPFPSALYWNVDTWTLATP